MSMPSSTGSGTEGSKSLAATAEERFFTLDHVGVVRHVEGVDLTAVVPQVKRLLDRRGATFEDATEVVNGITVYTSIAHFAKSGFTMWVKASEFEGVGILVDAKVFHDPEGGAAADEELSEFMAELEEGIAGRGLP